LVANLIAALIAGLGIGSATTAWIQYLLKRREVAHQSHRKDLEARYRVVILLMYAAFDFESNQTALRINRPDLLDKRSVLDELTAEWYNMMLFASEETLKSLRSFIQNPDKINLRKTASAMRKDLGRGTVSIEI
jgi:hypothetical protein